MTSESTAHDEELEDIRARLTEAERIIVTLTEVLGQMTPDDHAATGPGSEERTSVRSERPDRDEGRTLVWPPKSQGEMAGYGWGDAAGQDEWDALAAWVDWFAVTYDLKDTHALRACWPDHPGIVEELAALWMAWADAAQSSREDGGESLAYWHDRYLPGFLARQRHYQIDTCVSGKHEPKPVAQRTTDLTLISIRDTAITNEEREPAPAKESA